jgi:hypothetical protein
MGGNPTTKFSSGASSGTVATLNLLNIPSAGTHVDGFSPWFDLKTLRNVLLFEVGRHLVIPLLDQPVNEACDSECIPKHSRVLDGARLLFEIRKLFFPVNRWDYVLMAFRDILRDEVPDHDFYRQ